MPLAILIPIVVPVHSGHQTRLRMTKAQADVHDLREAVPTYRNHVGRPPATPDELTSVVANHAGEPVGPFLVRAPTRSRRWDYTYAPGEDGPFTVSARGDHMMISAP